MRSSSGRHGRRARSFRADDDSRLEGLSGTPGYSVSSAGDANGANSVDGAGNGIGDITGGRGAGAAGMGSFGDGTGDGSVSGVGRHTAHGTGGTSYAGDAVRGDDSGAMGATGATAAASGAHGDHDTYDVHGAHDVHGSKVYDDNRIGKDGVNKNHINKDVVNKDVVSSGSGGHLKFGTPQHVGRKGRSLLARTPIWARVLVVFLMTLFAAVSCVVTLYAASAARMVSNAQKVLTSAQGLANTALGCGSDQSLSEMALDLVDATNNLNEELNGPQWDFVRDHTRYGNDITAAREMLASVDVLVNGPFTDLLNLAGRLQGFSMKNGTVDVSALMDMPNIVADTHKDLKAQIARLDAIDTPTIGRVASILSTEKTALKTVDSMLTEYDDLVNLLPQLLGQNEERTYLVLVQNPAELRSAGGMVGTIAAVTAHNGKVTIGDFASTINWDIPDEPLDDTVYQERDVFGHTFDEYPATTTINPEFQRVAQYNKYLWLHQKGHENKNVAGVIGLDPVFLESLLDATGEVTLSDGKVLNGDTTVPFMLHDLYIEHPKFDDQNKYVSEAAHEIMTHVLGNANGSTLSALLKSVRETSAGGHLKLWMANQAEQYSLISTGLIDDKAGGELSTDETKPQAGIYLSELQQGKQDWYLKTTTTVTKTCGDTFAADNAAATGSLDNRIVQPVIGTQVSTIPADQLGEEYTVTFTMKNTMTKEEAKTFPEFITGGTDSEIPGGQLYRVVLTAPVGGEITVVQADTVKWGANYGTLYDRQYLSFDQDWIAPGEERTIAFTVRVKNTATQPLDVVTTPVVNKDGIETGSDGKVTDECPAGGTGSAAAQVNGGAVAGTDGTGAGVGAGADGVAGDSANGTANGQTGTQTDGQAANDGTGTTTNGQAGQLGGQSANGQNGTTANGTAGTTVKDPAAGLNALDKLKSQLSCPVDIKSLAGAA